MAAKMWRLGVLLLVVALMRGSCACAQSGGLDCVRYTAARRDTAFYAETQRQISDYEHWLRLHKKEIDSKLPLTPDISFSESNFSRINFYHRDLRYADFSGADLTEADFYETDLRNSFLRQVQDLKPDGSPCSMRTLLNGSVLVRTELAGADLEGADLSHAVFEPSSLPSPERVASAENLQLVTYAVNPGPLTQLRKALRDAGFGHAGDQLTYALRRRQAEIQQEGCWPGVKRSWPLDNLPSQLRLLPQEIEATGLRRNAQFFQLASHCIYYATDRFAFDLTCQYGMNKTRPIGIGAVAWLICSLMYLVFIHHPGESGLYMARASGVILDADAIKTASQVRPEEIYSTGLAYICAWVKRELILIRTAMFFSLMNAFNMGFKDADFGRWLRMLSRHEFDLRAKGWARTVSGVQALLTLYLLALWILTTFGNFFD